MDSLASALIKHSCASRQRHTRTAISVSAANVTAKDCTRSSEKDAGTWGAVNASWRETTWGYQRTIRPRKQRAQMLATFKAAPVRSQEVKMTLTSSSASWPQRLEGAGASGCACTLGGRGSATPANTMRILA